MWIFRKSVQADFPNNTIVHAADILTSSTVVQQDDLQSRASPCIPAPATCITPVTGSNFAHCIAAYRKETLFSIILLFSSANTAFGAVPVFCTPRKVPTASAAKSAAGNPFPVTSPK